MEDLAAEEEERWYDQQDLEQGEHGGRRKRGCRRARGAPRPLPASSMVGRWRRPPPPGKAELACTHPRGGPDSRWVMRASGENGDVAERRGALAWEDLPAKVGGGVGWGTVLLFLEGLRGHTSPQLARPNLEAGPPESAGGAGRWLLGGLAGKGGVLGGGEGGGGEGSYPKSGDRLLPLARIPELSDSRKVSPAPFPSLPREGGDRGAGTHPARGEAKIWSPPPPHPGPPP